MSRCPYLYVGIAIIFLCFFRSPAFADNPQASDDKSSLNATDPPANNSDDKNWEYSQSIKYSRGKYGTSLESETYEYDAMLQKDFDHADLSITIPSLWQTGNVIVTDDGREVIQKRIVRTTTDSIINPTITGLGDIAFDGSYYLFEEDRNAPLDVTLTSYVKAPTASAKNGLGTGKWDGGPGIGFTKKLLFNFKAFADASYILIGRIPGEDTLNQVNLDGGLQYAITPKSTASVKYEYSTSTVKGSSDSNSTVLGSPSKDIALSLDYKIDDDLKINAETSFGLSKSSPDETFMLYATLLFSGNTNSTNILTDPLFLALKKQIRVSTQYNYSLSKSSGYNYLGQKTANSSSDSNKFTQTIDYGITNRLSLTVGDSYQFGKAFNAVTTTGAITSSTNEGFNNPVIATKYRVLDQSSSPYDLDLTLSIAPNAFPSKEAGKGRNGSVASGTQPVAFMTGIGHAFNAFSIQGTFTTTYVGNRYYEVYSDDNNYLIQNYFNYTFALNTQTRFTDRLSINLGTAYTFGDKAYITNLSTGTQDFATFANTLDFNGSFNYGFIPNELVGRLTYKFDDFSNNKTIYSTPTSNTATKNHYAHTFGAILTYLY